MFNPNFSIGTVGTLNYAIGVPVQTEKYLSALSTLFAVPLDIPFGRAIIAANDTTIQLPSNAADIKVLGITVFNNKLVENSYGYGIYKAGSEVIILRKGQIWVSVYSNVYPGDQAYYAYSGDITKIGTFSNINNPAENIFFPSAVFRTSANAGQLALLEINLPGAPYIAQRFIQTGLLIVGNNNLGPIIDFNVAGVFDNDLVICQTNGSYISPTPYVLRSSASAGTIEVEMSAEMNANDIITYFLYR